MPGRVEDRHGHAQTRRCSTTTIGGSILLRTQNSDDPQSGELFRIAVEIRSDDDGVDIKLPGSIRADPDTGR